MSLNIIEKLEPARFRYINDKTGDTERWTLGLIAQEVENFYPKEEYSMVSEDPSGYRTLDYVQLIAPMIIAIQELSQRVKELEKRLENDDK